MRRWLTLVAVLIFTIILSGCAGSQSENTVKGKATQIEAVVKEETSTAKVGTSTPQIPATASKPSPDIIRDDREGINPVVLEIPDIDVKAEVEKVGLLANGQMGVPAGSENVAWYEPGPKPGELGNAVIAGHVDDLVNPAVFYDLNKLSIGDKINVTDQNGKQLTFVVRKKAVYPREDAPLDEIFGFTYRSMLNLITCEGKYNPKTTERAERLVVFTELVKG